MGLFLANQNAWSIGRSLLSYQVEMISQTIDILIQEFQIDQSNLTLFGSRHCGITALVTGVIDPRVKSIILRESLYSFEPIIRNNVYANIQNLDKVMLPGLLENMDINDLMGAISPRPLLTLNPSDHTGTISFNSRIKIDFNKVKNIYRLEGKLLGARLEQNITQGEELRTISKWLRKVRR